MKAEHSRLCKLRRDRPHGLVLVGALTACATSPSPSGPAVVVVYQQPCVPADYSAGIERGTHEWSEYGVHFDPASSAPECAYAWWQGNADCSLRIAVTFDAISTLGGAWGVTYIDARETDLAYPDTLPSLDVAACNWAHELGHSLWHDNAHLPAGDVGIMSAQFTGCEAGPTDADRAYVDAATGGAR